MRRSENALKFIIAVGFLASLLEAEEIIPFGVAVYIIPFSVLSILSFFIFSERRDEE